MRKRLNGQILRGSTIYYTFMRAQTGLSYLDRAEAKGEDPLSYRVTYELDGKQVEQSAKDFRKAGPKLIATAAKSTNGKVATLVTRGSKMKLNKQPKTAPKRRAKPVAEAVE